MAPFRHGRDDISPSPLDWSLLQNGPVVRVPDDGGPAVLLRVVHPHIDGVEPVIEALADISRFWLLFGRRFVTLAHTDNPDYRGPARLGATRAQWNPREWRNDARRLS